MENVLAGNGRRNDATSLREGGSGIPSLTGDVRHLIPKLGLREYWYPALRVKEVGDSRPKKVRMLGTDLCFFRDKDRKVAALNDVCPHRGARLSEGQCHFRGTVTCPYHAWTFDAEGKNIAVLSEGPDSKVCGKPGTEARVYPTQELRGVVFVWMGGGAPAPIAEDVPEEFFDPAVHMLVGTRIWEANWEVALENAQDSHVSYLHMNAWRAILRGDFFMLGGVGRVPVWVGNGFAGGSRRFGSTHNYYPALGGSWPKAHYRRLWGRFFRPLLTYPVRQKKRLSPKWVGGHHLPGMLRTVDPKLYTSRWCVPVEENRTRTWYFYAWPAAGRWERVLLTLQHSLYMQWLHERQFSQQDYSVMPNQRFDTPEKLSSEDAELVHWRRLVVAKHFGGRDTKIRFTGRSLVGSEGLITDEMPEHEVGAEQQAMPAASG